MTRKMSSRDYTAASSALVDWLDSQEIKPDDAVQVLTMTTVGLIGAIAVRNGSDARDGAKIIADIIVRSWS